MAIKGKFAVISKEASSVKSDYRRKCAVLSATDIRGLPRTWDCINLRMMFKRMLPTVCWDIKPIELIVLLCYKERCCKMTWYMKTRAIKRYTLIIGLHWVYAFQISDDYCSHWKTKEIWVICLKSEKGSWGRGRQLWPSGCQKETENTT